MARPIKKEVVGSDVVGLAEFTDADSMEWGGGAPIGSSDDVVTTAHDHDDRYYTEFETDTLLGGKSNTGHTHDDRYYTEGEIDTRFAGLSIDDLSDVVINVVAASEILQFVGGSWVNVSFAEAGISQVGHVHDDLYYRESEVDALITGHDHDGRYYTETEVDGLLNGKANVAHSHDLDELQDVVVDPSIADKELLTFDETSGTWINRTAGELGIPGSDLDSLEDVTLTTPADRDMLLFEAASNQWKNQPFDRDVPYANALGTRNDIDLTVNNEVPFALFDGTRSDIALVS